MGKEAYVTKLTSKTDLGTLKSILKVYITAYEINFGVRVRPKLIDTLVFYMLEGINRESDTMLSEMFNVPMTNIRVHKNELKKLGLLKKTKYKGTTSELNVELERLVELFKSKKDTNDFIYCLTFNNVNSGESE